VISGSVPRNERWRREPRTQEPQKLPDSMSEDTGTAAAAAG
jgi:hypothetical protein